MGTQLHQRPRSKKSKNDNYWTPQELFEARCKKHHLVPLLDVSADGKNTKCYWWINKKLNALKRDWVVKSGNCFWKRDMSIYTGNKRKVVVWCNPPNSKLGLFIRMAYDQFKKHKIKILMIIPTNTMSSDAFWYGIEDPKDRGEKVWYKPIKKRINFLENGKKSKFSARNAYLEVIWGKQTFK